MKKRVITHQHISWIEVYDEYMECWYRMNQVPSTHEFTIKTGLTLNFDSEQEAIETAKNVNIVSEYEINYYIP